MERTINAFVFGRKPRLEICENKNKKDSLVGDQVILILHRLFLCPNKRVSE
jgi:hypothetical protein